MKTCGSVVKTISTLGLQAGSALTGAPTALATSRIRWVTYFAYLSPSPTVSGHIARRQRASLPTMRVRISRVSTKLLIVSSDGFTPTTVMLSGGSAKAGFAGAVWAMVAEG